MAIMKLKLAQIEARLQALIEGSVARLFSYSQRQDNLASRLVEAMHANTQAGPDGEPVAPNLYTLLVHPSQLQVLQENRAVLDGLKQTIREAGAEANLRFSGAPAIRVAPDPAVATGEIQVMAQNSLDNLPQTSDLAVEQWDEAGAVPAGAFLIVDGTVIFPLQIAVVNMGRRLDNQIVVDDPRISRVHAQLRAIRGRYVIFDLDSTGGTFVNGERVYRCALYPGDVISLAGVPLVFGHDSGGLSETQDYAPLPSSHHPERKVGRGAGAVSFPQDPEIIE